MRYIETYIIYGHMFTKQIGFIKFVKSFRVSIYERANRFYAVSDLTGANISQGIGCASIQEVKKETSHKLAMHGASAVGGDIYQLLHIWGKKSLIRREKSLNFIQMKLIGIIK